MEDDSTLILEPQYDKMVFPGLDIKPSEDGQMGYGDMAIKVYLSEWNKHKNLFMGIPWITDVTPIKSNLLRSHQTGDSFYINM